MKTIKSACLVILLVIVFGFLAFVFAVMFTRSNSLVIPSIPVTTQTDPPSQTSSETASSETAE